MRSPSWVVDISTVTTALSAFVLSTSFLQLLARPLGRLSEAVDRAELMRLSWPFTLVAPRACAKSARLTARCGGVWRAMAMSLPGHTAFRHALSRAIRCEFNLLADL